MNVYSFKTLETINCVMAENITDALRMAESLLDKSKGIGTVKRSYNGIHEIHTVATNVYIAPEVVQQLGIKSELELQPGD